MRACQNLANPLEGLDSGIVIVIETVNQRGAARCTISCSAVSATASSTKYQIAREIVDIRHTPHYNRNERLILLHQQRVCMGFSL